MVDRPVDDEPALTDEERRELDEEFRREHLWLVDGDPDDPLEDDSADPWSAPANDTDDEETADAG